jgi:hypothetical protein
MLGTMDKDLRNKLTLRISDLFARASRWHWAAGYQAWNARELMTKGQLAEALNLATASVEQLRRDGCWEQLWRSLVLQSEILHAQADYEPAMRGLDEAAHMLKIVSSTIDDDRERSSYLNCADARTLERIRARITELVS